MYRSLIIRFIVLSFLFASAASAGPVLDDMLNLVRFDQVCPAGATDDGLPLLVGNAMNTTGVNLSRQTPLGQSFKVGPDAGMLRKVQVGVAWFDDHWQEGEVVTFTLYDSPKKEKKLFSREIDYLHKWYKWDLHFDLNISCRGDQEFYFELTHNGAGDNSIGVVAVKDDNYPRGQAYLDGKPQGYDLYFRALTQAANPDRTANLKRFFDNFDLDYPPLARVKAAFDAGDYETAGKELLEHFRSRTQPDNIYTPKKNPKYDRSDGDALIKHELTHMVDRKDVKTGKVGEQKITYKFLGDMITWRETWPGVSSPLIRPIDHISSLGYAYYQTGDEAFLRELMKVMRKFAQDYPSPFDGGEEHPMFWRPLNCGWRLGDGWDAWKTVLSDPKADKDVLLGWLNFMARMADFVSKGKAGGNQEGEAASALFTCALRFPEFKHSKEWVNLGFERLTKNTLKTIREDGICREPAINYHGMMTVTLHNSVTQAKKAGFTVPEDVWKRLEGMWDWKAYLMQPSGDVISYGDSDCAAFDSRQVWQGFREEQKDAALLFNRPDWLYIATAGKEGTPPAELSRAWMDSRYFVMRSDWYRETFNDARYLFFKAGVGGSHGHKDMGEICLYAYGMPLVIDPGRTNYGTTLMQQLAETSSHSLCIVDDLGISGSQPKLHRWITNPAFDIADNSYPDQYPGIENRRAALYVRSDRMGGDYWVLFDNLLGKLEGTRKFDQQFWLTPPTVKIDEVTKTVSTSHDWGGNLDLIPVETEGLTVKQRGGQCDCGEVRNDVPVVSFHREQATPCAFTTVMYPYPVGKPKPPVKTASLASTENVKAISVTINGATDYIIYNLQSDPERLTDLPQGIRFRGDILIARMSGDGRKVERIGWAGGRGVVINKQPFAWSDKPIESLSVRYSGDTLFVDTDKPEPTLVVSTQGAAKMVVNGGKPVVVSKKAKTVKPFGK